MAGGTAVAMVLAFVVFTATTMLVDFGFELFRLGEDLALLIRSALAAGIGAYLGVHAASAACDALLKFYARTALFVMFVLLAVAGIAYELFADNTGWSRLAPIIQMVVASVASYQVFLSPTHRPVRFDRL